MGVQNLWQMLKKEGNVVEEHAGKEGHQSIINELQGKVVAVDLSMWLLQAGQSEALAEHFTQIERCIKVSFERALQMLRHGVIPVIVVDGIAPVEKQAAQRDRYYSQHGHAGGGTLNGANQFLRQGKIVAQVLDHLGLPIVYAPGEAEATCAALCKLGAVDAIVTNDGDAAVYGATVIYKSLKLSTIDIKSCEVQKFSIDVFRRMLGITSGGEVALSCISSLAGCDYDKNGAQGVGSLGAVALVKHLLAGKSDDSHLLADFEALLRRRPDQRLLTLSSCTGCKTCGHEGHKKGSIKCHSKQNPCALCPPTADGRCSGTSSGRCSCDFHRLADARKAERIAERIRTNQNVDRFLNKANNAIEVFVKQYSAAEEHVKEWLEKKKVPIGQKLTWQHRPLVAKLTSDFAQYGSDGLKKWELDVVRGKLIPVLMEWDIRHPRDTARIEFKPVSIQKVGGFTLKQLEENPNLGWRYVVKWERTSSNLEGLGSLGEDKLTLIQYDQQWLDTTTAEHKSVSKRPINQYWPAVAEAWQATLVAKTAKKAPKQPRVNKKKGTIVTTLTSADIIKPYLSHPSKRLETPQQQQRQQPVYVKEPSTAERPVERPVLPSAAPSPADAILDTISKLERSKEMTDMILQTSGADTRKKIDYVELKDSPSPLKKQRSSPLQDDDEEDYISDILLTSPGVGATEFRRNGGRRRSKEGKARYEQQSQQQTQQQQQDTEEEDVVDLCTPPDALHLGSPATVNRSLLAELEAHSDDTRGNAAVRRTSVTPTIRKESPEYIDLTKSE